MNGLTIGCETPPTKLEALFRAHLAAHPQLIPPRSSVVVALSGGSDSMALLHLLVGLTATLRLSIAAAHFDHGLRAASVRETEVVSRWARGLGVPCHFARSPQLDQSTQAQLRAARLRWLEQVRRSRGAHRLVLGHQADDQAETVLFRIMRGTDLRGLAGIPHRRGPIVRPLLPFRRSQIQEWLRARGIGWLEDPSNTDPRWTRSRIRSEIMPQLDGTDGAFVARLLGLSSAAARAETTLEALTVLLARRAGFSIERASRDGLRVKVDREVLLTADPELRARVLRGIARSLGVDLTAGGTRAGVEFISEGRSGGRVDLGGGLKVSREFARITIGPTDAPQPSSPLEVPDCRVGRGALCIGGQKYVVRWYPARAGQQRPDRIAVPVPRGHYPLRFREWRPGDRIRLPGGTRKLKKLFNDRRIPAGDRTRVPVLVDSRNRILWVAGLAVAEAEPDVEYEDILLELELTDA